MMGFCCIAILNYNGKHWLEKFLPVAIDLSKYPIVVVDNGSTDESLQFLSNHYPSLQVLAYKDNKGYAGGYNRAIRDLDFENFILLNSDIEVAPNWDKALIQFLVQDEQMAACQPKVLQYNNKKYFEFAGAAGGYIDKFGYPFCRGRVIDVLEKDLGQYDDAVEIFWATGACLAIKKHAFLKVGGFDEDFFAHMEEIDLCWRLRLCGYSIQYCPQSVVYHVGGGTLQNGSDKKFYLNFRNSLWMLYKNLPTAKLFPIIFIRLCLDGMASIYFTFKGSPQFLWIVLKVHFEFYFSLPKLIKKRVQVNQLKTKDNPDKIYNGSIVANYFLRKKRLFSEFYSE